MKKEETLENLLNQDNKTSSLRLSASRVTSFIQDGPQTLLERRKISNEGIKIGGLIDCLLYEPDKFEEKYHVGDIKKPTASLGLLADVVIADFEKDGDKLLENMYFNQDDEVYTIEDDLLQFTYDTSIRLDLWKRSKYNTVIEKFYNNDFLGYIYEMALSKDKELITYDEHNLALEVIDILKNHKHSKHLFKNKLENYYQFKAEFTYKDFDFLGYIDHIQIDHKNKTICGKDLKTGTPKAMQFFNSFLKYKYYIQGKLYQIALESIKKQLSVDDYEILPFEFVYISRFEKLPVIYKMGSKWEQYALDGFITNRGITYPGLDDTLVEIQWHLDNQIFNINKTLSENNGYMNLNSDIINDI